MMTTNKSTKTFAYGIATGAAAIGVLAGSVFTATSASADGHFDNMGSVPRRKNS
jgi:hypothetical protein